MADAEFLATPHFAAKPNGRLFSRDEFDSAEAIIRSIPGYAPTPLRDLTSLAPGPRRIWYKDEAGRFDNGSFKALGAAVAVAKAIEKHGPDVVVVAATAGNYGRALAWAAADHGLRCIIYVHADVGAAAVAAIARYGAEVRHVPGDYDQAVDTAASEATAEGWLVVSDTSSNEHDSLPRWVMTGYAVMMAEVERQTEDQPDVILLPGGVGGLAAAVAGWFELKGNVIPQLYVFEPVEAACLLESARHDELREAQGSLKTELLPLCCRQPSALAWPVLARTAAGFLTIGDDDAAAGQRSLQQLGLEAGICSGAAVGALNLLASHQDLTARSILLVGTEGLARVTT